MFLWVGVVSFTTKPKIVELFYQSLHKHVTWVQDAKVPRTLPFMTAGTEVAHINMRAMGKCTVNGIEMEFCDVRIFAKAPPE